MTRLRNNNYTDRNDFNSHAHVERDAINWFHRKNIQISTHTLTWSVTHMVIVVGNSELFQLTRSRGAWRHERKKRHDTRYFNSHAHVERDFGVQVSLICMNYFNSHAHVERDIADEYGYEKYSRFQLTRSRGAWRAENGNDYFAVIISTHTLTWSVTCKEKGFTIWICHFNSHAHVERDDNITTIVSMIRNFNSHAHVERDQTQK